MPNAKSLQFTIGTAMTEKSAKLSTAGASVWRKSSRHIKSGPPWRPKRHGGPNSSHGGTMTEADLIIINATEWIPAERLLAELTWYYGDPSGALNKLVSAYETGDVKSARVPYADLKPNLNFNATLVQMAAAREKGAVSKEQIETFIA